MSEKRWRVHRTEKGLAWRIDSMPQYPAHAHANQPWSGIEANSAEEATRIIAAKMKESRDHFWAEPHEVGLAGTVLEE